MQVLFLDDSYIESQGRNITVIGGFMIDYEKYLDLKDEVIDLKSGYNLLPNNPIKWSPGQTDKRYNAQRKFTSADQKEFKRKVLKKLGNSDILVVACFVDNESGLIRKKIDAKKRAIEYLSQRFQRQLGLDDVGIIISDSFDSENTKIVEHYRDRWYDPSYSKPESLFDGLLFSHSLGCVGIQLADFIVGSMCSGVRDSSRHFHYVDCYKEKIRKGLNDEIKGYGIIVYPSNSSKLDNFIVKIRSGT